MDVALPPDLPDDKMDNRILKVCRGLADRAAGEARTVGETDAAGEDGAGSAENQVILVTKDILLRIKAQIIGIRAEDFTTEQVSGHEEQYEGRAVYVPEALMKDFNKKGIPLEVLYQTDSQGMRIVPDLWENQFLILRADQSVKKTQLGRVENGRAVPLRYKKSKPYGISPRNAGQHFSRRP